MKKIIVTGCGTGVGKTVVSGIIAQGLLADYWKPIECGSDESSDSKTMRTWLNGAKGRIHPPSYTFKAPISPHAAARLENKWIDPALVRLPCTNRSLIIETVGGVLVPLNLDVRALDLFQSWEAIWIVVSRHYVGSINHTLLTIEELKRRGLALHSIVFNGRPNHESENAIIHYSKLPCLGRLYPEKEISPHVIKKYSLLWQQPLQGLIR